MQLKQQQEEAGDPTAASSTGLTAAAAAHATQIPEEVPQLQHEDVDLSSDEEAANAAQLEQ